MAKYQKPFVKTEFFEEDKRRQEAMRMERVSLRSATEIDSFYGRYEGMALGTNIHKYSATVKTDVVLGELIEMVNDGRHNPTELFMQYYDELLPFMTQPAQSPRLAPYDLRPFEWHKDLFGGFIFLKFDRNGVEPVLHCFVNNQEYRKPAVMVRLCDWSLWVTSDFAKGAEVIPLSHKYIEFSPEHYRRLGINTADYVSFIDVFERLHERMICRPNKYSEAMLNYLTF